MQSQEFEFVSELGNERLDRVISHHLPDLTRSRIKNLIEESTVWVNGAPATKAGQLVKRGERIKVIVARALPASLEAVEIPQVKLLFEDEHLAVIEKPAGISVHPASTEKNPTVVHALLYRFSKTLSSSGGLDRPGIVHRIDKGTSGILVISKTESIHVQLSKLFKSHTIERRYLALVYGDVKTKTRKTAGTIETFFGRSRTNRKKMTGKLTALQSKGRKAITHWKVAEQFKAPVTLLECTLETGRTHQIRVHLSELTFSIVGDPLYGAPSKAGPLEKKFPKLHRAITALDHQLLHAKVLGFQHPATGQNLRFETDVPTDFKEVLELCRG